MVQDPSARKRPERIGEQLIKDGIITVEQLEFALTQHHQVGVPLGRVLVSSGYASERQVALCLARQASLPFVDLHSADPPDRQVAHLLPYPSARDLRLLPLKADDGGIVLASPAPPHQQTLTEAVRLLGRPVLPAVAEPTAFESVFDQVHRDQHVEIATSHLASGSPDDSAQRTLTRGQRIFLLCVLALLGAGGLLDARLAGIVVASISTVFYAGFSVYKMYLVFRALTHKFEIQTTEAEIAALQDRDLPVYTLLVPLYHEAELLPTLVRAIQELDYPRVKLDVRLLLEQDDRETIAAARAAHLPSYFTLVVVPPGQPKGKPKACNYGMIQARGEYVVIYDAEDLPEPDQLKKALVAFRKGGERLACVQAKLNFFNPGQNLLTRWFTSEYSMWFDLLLPGLDADGAPIPLGGTSNHFPVRVLREIGAWDPNNVTEDADLGVRLCKAGWKTAIMDSTTYEEANPDLYNWIRQRSRWVKGYIQTYLVHMRHPLRLRQRLGTRNFLSFQLVVGGTFFTLLINPLFWLLTIVWFATRSELIHTVFPAPILYLGTVALFLGNFTFLYLNIAGCLQRGHYDLVPVALLSPAYWALMSVAAWKGFLQLFYAPSYWEKTRHGLHTTGPRPLESAVRGPAQAGVIGARRAQAHPVAIGAPAEGVRLSVVIPAFNEEHRLSETLAAVAAHLKGSGLSHEILVVDDGSTDRTGDVAWAAAEHDPCIRVLHHQHRGKGAAVRSGVFASRGSHVLFCDADLPMPVEDLMRMDSILETSPVVIASREGPGAMRTGEPLHRHLMGRAFNLLTRAMALPHVRDTQCGLKGFSAIGARDIFSRQSIDGFGFDVELLLIASRLGYAVQEMPIRWSHRPSSRVDPVRDTLRMVVDLLRIKWKDCLGVYTSTPFELAHPAAGQASTASPATEP